MADDDSSVDKYADFKAGLQDIVSIILPSGKKFVVHTTLLTETSGYFKAALKHSFIEGQTHKVRLEENARDGAFTLIMQWIYTGDFGRAGAWSGNEYTWKNLFDTWLLADYLGMPKLQNHIVDRIVKCAPSADDESISVFPDFFERAAQDCPIRKLLVAVKAARETSKKIKNRCVEPMLMEVLQKVEESRNTLAEKDSPTRSEIDVLCKEPDREDFYVKD